MAGSSSSSKQLQRRLRGLGPKRWDFQADRDLLAHLATTRSLGSLDELSDCISRATEHIFQISEGTNRQKLSDLMQNHLMPLLQLLFTALGPALQQLGDGLQQYSSSGQLPAAVTDQALDAVNCMCQLLGVFYQLTRTPYTAQQEQIQSHLAQCARDAGGCNHHITRLRRSVH
jgi:hypothetical protein